MLHNTFDETSGTTASDSSGNGNTGTLTNMSGTEWTTGKVGGALASDGTNDYVNLGSVASSDPLASAGSAFTFAAWINPTYTSGSYQRIVDKSTDWRGKKGYAFSVGSGSGGDVQGRLYLQVNLNQFHTVGTGLVSANTWTHVAVTGDGSNYQFYVNGVAETGAFLVGSYNSPPSATAGTSIGIRKYDGFRKFGGSIDELRIYNSALSAGQVSALAGSAPEPAETFAFLGLLTAAGLGFREWRDRKAKTV